MREKKYKYLYQLMITSAVLVIVPVLFFYSVVWKKAVQEVNYLSKEYYANALDSFFTTFKNETKEFRNQVFDFSTKSRVSYLDSGIFYYGTEKMEDSAYYYREAANTLAEYGYIVGYGDISVYYYEKDFVLKSKHKYTLEEFFKDNLQIQNTEKELVAKLFSPDQFVDGKIMLAPLYNDEGISRECLVGVCTVLGKNKEKALMFYQMTPDDTVYNGIPRSNFLEYFIVDNDSQAIVLSEGATIEGYSKIQTLFQEDKLKELLETEYFVRVDEDLGVTFLVDASNDIVQKKVVELYDSTRFLFAYIIIIMLMIYTLMVCLNYRPIQGLLNKVGHSAHNEFDAILSAWQKQNDLLMEQRMSIMDLLMNHMLYGIPISHRYIEKIGVNRKTKYCVFVIKNSVLKSAQMEELILKTEELFGALLFINDIMGVNATVCIFFMEKDDAEVIKEWLNGWCKLHVEGGYELKAGYTVDDVSDIQKSFNSCMKLNQQYDNSGFENEVAQETLSNKVRQRIIINEKLKEKILDYLDEHFMERDLSQQSVADQFDISVYSLSKMFNEQIGTRFVDYINGKRVEYAKTLLVTTEKNVKEIALEVGYAGQKYFTEIFKKYAGRTPVQFRGEYENKKEGGF